MKALLLSEVAALLNKAWTGPELRLASVMTDSRKPQENSLFVALCGERFDGHDFIEQARSAGARAALVERDGDWGLPCLVVEDTRLALGQLAAALRAQLPVQLVGVTGSNGKTTVKEMIAAILREGAPTLATEGNLNNAIGVPLTLLRLDVEHAFGVIEMGASSQGEIAYLTELVRPAVGVITNVGPSHLHGFGSLIGVAQAKGELLQGLAAESVAVINADDDQAPLWRRLAGGRRVIDFGMTQPAAVSAQNVVGSGFQLQTPVGEVPVQLPLPGRHNIMNALAAAAAALALSIPLAQIASGLAAVPSIPGRLNRRAARAGASLLDDSYNANPSSLRAGLDVLAAEPGQRWLVLGDMGELGEAELDLHAQAGLLAQERGVQRLFAVGRLAPAAAESFGAGGEVFESKAALIERLLELLQPTATILVKGSRSSGMEQVVEALLAPESMPVAKRGLTCCFI